MVFGPNQQVQEVSADQEQEKEIVQEVSADQEQERETQTKPKKMVLKANTDLVKDTLKDVPTLMAKDMGPQIDYQTVFIIEYAGPLFIWFLCMLGFHGPSFDNMSTQQLMGSAMFIFHYIKREMETLFVHTFSHPTMPVRNVFKNSIYYWGWALLMAYHIMDKEYTPVSTDLQFHAGVALFFMAEFGNLYCHIKLRLLRSGGKTGYQLPTGFLFNSIICPNYTTELLAWVGFNIATQCLWGWLFLLCGFVQIYAWAVKKQARLVKMFPETKSRALLFVSRYF
ncbi:hypothetical protein KIPB_008025 [Kipferlia bialata]|uniref:3-oxo-5-alpha-steroid 4-dehydrogenase C-terminal domain-containing protein n=1 Tax=Kipferlia bialata TaxID=797122 RepID=A0A9K3CZD4_9EUKA|nr:hypothetical protein KIPB_008025 [Kipferlia bialata]|eukprot:g8025.t1